MNTLKPGDWVRYKGVAQISHITHTGYHLSNGYITKGDNGELKLWKPQPNEWCWFWNKYMDIDQCPKLAQFHFMVEELQEPIDFPAFYQTKYKTIKLGYVYDFCEPYIGRLPSVLKDNKCLQ